ncbi:bifunctional DNA-formamidopyrimidine glycosylase/DNA-(apurinic or apyrimidinic site) lyase [bacterium]|nr:bifunctional DNA-formamidopyrimidine glycosylase/DNA-(apurinic or apyrimidinic site) lyase [bacterium]
MPELPEVETIRRGLAEVLPGRRIAKAVASIQKMCVSHLDTCIADAVAGETYDQVRRIGKILIIDLEKVTLLVRLGMTGQLTFRDPKLQDDGQFSVHPVTGLQRAAQHAPDKHTHIVIEHSDGTMLCYRDIRRFGRWIAYPRAEADSAEELRSLGPDPLACPQELEAHLLKALAKTSRAIKTVLLDQSVVCGLGNIYADEALFGCGICPSRPANSLAPAEIASLAAFIPPMLLQSIANRGTTFSDYRDSSGHPGSNQNSLQVYGRYGSACYKCGTVLEKCTLGGRTSTWCPRCQS